MKLPLSRLKELVPGYDPKIDELRDVLTFSGTEVDAVEEKDGDVVLDCAVTSNRVDCFGWIGLARDVAAATGRVLAPPPTDVATSAPATSARVRIDVEDPAFCPRYVGVVVEGVTVGPSPAWLKAALEAVGVRPVNNVVDVTNYVLFERNQPLHAFDLDRVRGGRIVVRRGRPGERLKAINGREYAVDATTGLICDGEGPVAIAGVMGGLDSEVGSGTKRVLIESACFDAPSVRRTARRLELRSDASHRFERGVDAHGALAAALRAARLIVDVAGGTVRAEPLDVRAALPTPAPIRLRAAQVARVAGVAVPAARSAEILRALGCVATVAGDEIATTPPTWRRDLSREIDLVEEIVRIEGLHKIPMGAGLRVAAVRPHPGRRLADAVRDACVRLGHLECVTPTFVAEGAPAAVAFAAEGGGLVARRPIRAGEGAVRRSLLPSLLEVRARNQDQGLDRLRLFEVANAAFDVPGAIPLQLPLLGALIDGVRGDKTVEGDVRDGRGFVEALGDLLGVAFTFAPYASPHLASDRALAVLLDGKKVGVAGVVAPALVEREKLRAAPVYVELDLAPLASAWRPVKTFAGLPKFPAVTRDLAFVLDESRTYAELESALRAAAPRELESISFFDEFRGASLGPAKKSLALTLTFRSDEGTLEGSRVDGWIAAAVASAGSSLGASLRA